MYSFYVILHVNCQFDAFYVLLCCQTIFETLNTSIEAFFMLNAWQRKTRENYIYRKKPSTTSGQLRKSQNTSQKISKTAKNRFKNRKKLYVYTKFLHVSKIINSKLPPWGLQRIHDGGGSKGDFRWSA